METQTKSLWRAWHERRDESAFEALSSDNRREGHSTSSASTDAGSIPPSRSRSAPSWRVNGTGALEPFVIDASTRYVNPCRYQVTILVHSPASVAASS